MAEHSSGGGGGLFGKLLLPGYTDAGASTTFKTINNDADSDADDDADQDHDQDLVSEVATEVIDNRTSTQHYFRNNNISNNISNNNSKPEEEEDTTLRYSPSEPGTTTTAATPTTTGGTTTATDTTTDTDTATDIATTMITEGEGSTKYGFFPSTKPPTQMSMSPRPVSPPMLMRRQLPTAAQSSVAGTSVVPQTGAYEEVQPEQRLKQRLKLDNENTSIQQQVDKQNNQFQYWNEEGNNEDAVADNYSNSKIHTLNAANLQTIERENAPTPLETCTNSTTDSSTDGGGHSNSNRESSLLEKDDTTTTYTNTNTHQEFGSGSEVLSTASEFGTVINIGGQSARLAEVDAMAALIEASPNVEPLLFMQEPSPSTSPIDNELTLPQLETTNTTTNNTKSFDRRPFLPQSKTKQPTQDMGLSRTAAAVTVATAANVTANPTTPLNPTASEMVTAAIRRIGSGLQKTKASLSAPPTPKTPGVPPAPRVEDLLNLNQLNLNLNLKASTTSTLTPRTNPDDHDHDHSTTCTIPSSSRTTTRTTTTIDPLPPSFALRSPGSSARQSLSNRNTAQQQQQQQRRAMLRPRFSPAASSSLKQQSMPPRNNNTTNNNYTNNYASDKATPTTTNTTTTTATTAAMLIPVGPFRLAQKCFSFDSTLDNDHFVVDADTIQELPPSVRQQQQHQQQHQQQQHQRAQQYYHYPKSPKSPALLHSQSWDVGAFRSPPSYYYHHHRSQDHHHLHQRTASHSHELQRARLHSDFSPTKHSTQTMELQHQQQQQQQQPTSTSTSTSTSIPPQTPKQNRIEVEREDALDILACLVERGVAAWNTEGTTTTTITTDDYSTIATIILGEELTTSTTASTTTPLENNNKNNAENHAQQRMAALDELLKSHAYALEMKRAAFSASTWLKSIGRCTTTAAAPPPPLTTATNIPAATTITDSEEAEESAPTMPAPSSEGGQASGEEDKIETASSSSTTAAAAADSNKNNKMEVLTLKAMLHSAQMELEKRTEMAQTMDVELSKCRAEIGRLQIASRAEVS
jgi:hypothetical protein